MCNLNLIPLIKKYQQKDMSEFNQIYEVFERLIIYYSRHLNYDDSLQEINVFLVELLYKINLEKFNMDNSFSLKNYIAVCIRNKYISLSKLRQLRNEMFTDYCECIAYIDMRIEDEMILSNAFNLLTERQREVIMYKYIYGYSDSEISSYLHITRQAVNRLKTRGLLILKEFMNIS